MLKREHDRAVMNALDVFRKSEISNSTYDQDDHHRDTYIHEVRKRYREKDKKRKAAVQSKTVRPLRSPLWPEDK